MQERKHTILVFALLLQGRRAIPGVNSSEEKDLHMLNNV